MFAHLYGARLCCIMSTLKIYGWVTLRVSGEHLKCYELGHLKSILRKVLEMPITQPAQDIITGWNFILHMLKQPIEQKGALMSMMHRNLMVILWLSASRICWICDGKYDIFKELSIEINPWETVSFFLEAFSPKKMLAVEWEEVAVSGHKKLRLFLCTIGLDFIPTRSYEIGMEVYGNLYDISALYISSVQFYCRLMSY